MAKVVALKLVFSICNHFLLHTAIVGQGYVARQALQARIVRPQNGTKLRLSVLSTFLLHAMHDDGRDVRLGLLVLWWRIQREHRRIFSSNRQRRQGDRLPELHRNDHPRRQLATQTLRPRRRIWRAKGPSSIFFWNRPSLLSLRGLVAGKRAAACPPWDVLAAHGRATEPSRPSSFGREDPSS